MAAVGSGLSAPAALGAGELVAQPDTLYFESPVGGTPSAGSLLVHNLGPDPVVVEDVTLLGDVGPFDFAGGSCEPGITLAVSVTCSVDLAFSPAVLPATHDAWLVVTGGDEDLEAVAFLAGETLDGTPAPGRLTASPNVLNLTAASGGVDSSGASVTVRNTGGTMVPFEAQVTSGPFRITGSTCPQEIHPSAQCTLTVVYSAPQRALRGIATGGFLFVRTNGQVTGSVLLRGRVLNASFDPLTQTKTPRRLVSSQRVARSLAAAAAAIVPLVRGRPRGRVKLPFFNPEASGLLRLQLTARKGKRKVMIASSRTAVGYDKGSRPGFRLNRIGRELLQREKAVRMTLRLRFEARDNNRTYRKSRSFVVKPPTREHR